MKNWRNIVFQYSVIIWAIFLVCCCMVDAYQVLNVTRLQSAREPHEGGTNSYYFMIDGDLHQSGLYQAVVQILGVPNEFFLDIDTGSDLTWISCSPSNVHFLQPLKLGPTPHQPYMTNNKFVSCEDDTVCGFVSHPGNPACSTQYQQCDYKIEYADQGSSLGVLVKDTFLLQSSLGGSMSQVDLTFGCGYHQEFDVGFEPPFADGVLGIGNGKASILSQLFERGMVANAFALCLSSVGPGYLVLGSYDQSNMQGVIWMGILLGGGNKLGPADLFYDGQEGLGFGLTFLFDSGTTYNYFDYIIYPFVLGKLLTLAENVATRVEDPYLPVCWKPLTSSYDVYSYFKPLRFNITDDVYFQLESWDYLVDSPLGNVCLGILDGKDLGPELENVNIIGDVALLDKLVIYDYEKQKIGWVVKDCMQAAQKLSGKKRKNNRNSRRGIPKSNRQRRSNKKKEKA